MKLPLAPAGALVLGGAAALCALAAPTPMLESWVMASGLPAVFAAAEPPLGFTARVLLALVGGTFVTLVGCLALFVLLGTRSITIGRTRKTDLDSMPFPAIRRADAHPDAPPRAPLMATRDLGTPFLEIRASRESKKAKPVAPVAAIETIEDSPIVAPEPVAEVAPPEPVEQPLPQDLDQPLAAFDPDAMPEVPLEAPVALPPLSRAPTPPVFEPSERFEVYELMPPVRPAPAPVPSVPREDRITRPETEASVHALLERLERGVVRNGLAAQAAQARPFRERRQAERGIEDTLVTLRNLARRA